VFRGDIQKGGDALPKAARILLPEQVVQKNPHRVHAQLLRPSELDIDALRIERVGLPHLELVDRARRNVVAAQGPGLSRIPRIGLLRSPALARGGKGRRCEEHQTNADQSGRNAIH
jgi:hypothetical protein